MRARISGFSFRGGTFCPWVVWILTYSPAVICQHIEKLVRISHARPHSSSDHGPSVLLSEFPDRGGHAQPFASFWRISRLISRSEVPWYSAPLFLGGRRPPLND